MLKDPKAQRQRSCFRRGPLGRFHIFVTRWSIVFASSVVQPTSAVITGARRGKVESFLCSALAPATQILYSDLASSFDAVLWKARGEDTTTMTESEIDYALADEVVDLFTLHEGTQGVAKALQLVAAVAKYHPRHRYSTAFSALEVWRRRHPAQQAFPMPIYLALAGANVCALLDEFAAAAAWFLCTAGLLRISEALALTWDRCIRTPSAYVLLLASTKRGAEQKVMVTGAAAMAWIDGLKRRVQPEPRDKVCPINYAKFAKLLRWVTGRLGHAEVDWTSHSLRRGRATAMHIAGVAIEDIMVAGRWESLRSCRLYLRAAESSQLRMVFPSDAVNRATAFAALGAAVW
jgi:hypothetical protein